ncbi:MAG: Atu4866 domain-containing protein [Galbibacter orientalis]|uniref:Atu4866 domain-containing protein n=1 Tax=Galbibacter orientalis TaxID=453852 RepID=UPI0030020FA2
MIETKGCIRMWATKGETLATNYYPNNCYDEARGDKKTVYQGDYHIMGNHIDYKDDTGFTVDGEYRNGILYHSGMVLYKEN